MAAKDVDGSGSITKQELVDLTTCCICTDVYTVPTALPCIHTFCMKCLLEIGLKTGKRAGDDMPCPVCRQLFNIPAAGFHGLPKNFFIERLIQVANVSDEFATSRVLCDACVEENKEDHSKEIPSASTYCVDCIQKFCEECCKQHRKFKLTKNHKLVAINEHEGDRNVTINLAPCVCELHEQKILDVYCADCKTVVCAICFIENHNNHQGSLVKKFADGFRKEMESIYKTLDELRSQAEVKKEELLKVKENILERIENTENDVKKRHDELKQVADKHETSLLQYLCLVRQSKLKEIQMTTDDIDALRSSLEAYNSYCQNVMAKGSDSDICCSFSALSIRAVELQKQGRPIIEREPQSFNICLRKSELEDCLQENLIGEIEEESDSKPKKRSRTSVLEEQRIEIDELRKQIEIIRRDNESLRLGNEQQLSKEKVFYDAQIQKISQELDNNAGTSNALKAQNDQLAQEVERYKTTIKTLKSEVKKCQNNIEKLEEDKRRYKSDPVFVKSIKTKTTEEKKKEIRGMTILDKELFVVSDTSSEVEVYDCTELRFSRQFISAEFTRPLDIVSCVRNKCLYISKYKGQKQSSEILKMDPYGNVKSKWKTGDDYGYYWGGAMSVTNESTIILTLYEKNRLHEYLPNGKQIREINLSSFSGIIRPLHAIKLANGDFVVTHGYHVGDQHRVCIVNQDGMLTKSFGGSCGSAFGQLNLPIHVSTDGNGFVMITDNCNSRGLLLDTDLEFKREILSREKHELWRPYRILMDESDARLYVANNEANNSKILIYNFK